MCQYLSIIFFSTLSIVQVFLIKSKACEAKEVFHSPTALREILRMELPDDGIKIV